MGKGKLLKLVDSPNPFCSAESAGFLQSFEKTLLQVQRKCAFGSSCLTWLLDRHLFYCLEVRESSISCNLQPKFLPF